AVAHERLGRSAPLEAAGEHGRRGAGREWVVAGELCAASDLHVDAPRSAAVRGDERFDVRAPAGGIVRVCDAQLAQAARESRQVLRQSEGATAVDGNRL